MLRWTLILLFMFLKAGFIVAIFMHMNWERLALKLAILVPPLVPPDPHRPDGGRRRLHVPHALGVLHQARQHHGTCARRELDCALTAHNRPPNCGCIRVPGQAVPYNAAHRIRTRSATGCRARSLTDETRGWIVPIGGAENKENDPRILQRFVDVSGGENADIVVIPTASRRTKPVIDTNRCSATWVRARLRHGFRHAARLPGAQAARAARTGERHLLHRRQPAAADDAARRHAGGQADTGPQRARRHGGRDERGCEHPLRAHDRLRRRRLVRDLGQRAARAGARAHQPLRDRPAFP